MLLFQEASWLSGLVRERDGGCEAEWSGHQNLIAGFVLGSSCFNTLAVLLHSQFACLSAVGILNKISSVYLSYLFHLP